MSLQKCVCIDTLFTELPWEARFQKAKDSGFSAVEFWDWRTRDLETTKKAAESAGIVISGFNGDADFSLVDPTEQKDYLAYLKKSLDYAKAVGSKSVALHSNALGEGGIVVNHYENLSHTVKLCAMYGTLTECVKLAEEYEIKLNLEALNTSTDHAGNFLVTTQMCAEICRLINSPWLNVLYDVYHMQLSEGSIGDNIKAYGDRIGHVHIADAPGRHEPGTGELNYKFIIDCLEKNGYQGYIGYELFPEKDTETAVKAIMQWC